MLTRETRASSKKRKADSITSSPTISSSSRLKKTKLTAEDSDDDIVVRDSVHISIRLAKQFDKISLDSPRTSLRPKPKDKTTSQPESAKKTRRSAKGKEMSEIHESEESEEEKEEKGEKGEKGSDDDDDDLSIISEKTRRTRSASRAPRAKFVYPSEIKSYSTAKKTRASSSEPQSNSGSGKKRGRKPKNQQKEEVPTRASTRVPKTSTLKTPIETPIRTPTKSASKSGSNQKSGKKGKTTSKKSLGKIDEREESETSSTGNCDDETRDDDVASKKSDLDNIVFNKKKPLKIVKIVRHHPPPQFRGDRFHEVLKKFDDAILNLQEYTLPDKIPCREDEKKTIKDFVYEGLKNQGHSHCLYISGVPGIGKTVSVLEVIKQIQKDNENTDTDFNFIHVNGLGLPNPESAYQTILKSIVNIKDMSNSSACVILNNLFQKGTLPQAFKQHKSELDKRVRLVLLDELDYLITKDQNLLYNLFDWPHFKHSKLIIVGIANTMNLPEQLLPKITSRMGNRRLVYKPYTSSQIENILQSRIEKMDIIRPEAITFLSKKIATFSSDIRRTLHVCREALKMCREEFTAKYQNDQANIKDQGLLEIGHIRSSYNSVYSSPYHECISALMDNSKLLLLAVCLEMKSKAQPTVGMNEIQDRIKGMLNNLGRKPIPHSETKQILGQLTSLGLVQGKSKATLKKDSHANSGRLNNIMDIQVTLKISVDDVTNALRSDELMSKYTDLL